MPVVDDVAGEEQISGAGLEVAPSALPVTCSPLMENLVYPL